jgi:LuxR family transcriptional regulator, maltose regulon positive regulatory protein
VLGNISTSDPPTAWGKRAVVEGLWVYGPGLPPAGLRLGCPAWFAWLELATTTSFSYPLFERRGGYIIGFMTVRKERRQRGGAYWTAYRRQGHRLRKIYLGASSTLTHARLEAVVATLIEEGRKREGGKDTHAREG